MLDDFRTQGSLVLVDLRTQSSLVLVDLRTRGSPVLADFRTAVHTAELLSSEQLKLEGSHSEAVNRGRNGPFLSQSDRRQLRLDSLHERWN